MTVKNNVYRKRLCKICGAEIINKRDDKATCGEKCRKAWYRKRKGSK